MLSPMTDGSAIGFSKLKTKGAGTDSNTAGPMEPAVRRRECYNERPDPMCSPLDPLNLGAYSMIKGTSGGDGK